MKLFKIETDAKIVEPAITGTEIPIVYLGQKYLALLVGDKMPKGTKGLKELDWQSDPEIKKDAAEQMAAVANPENFGEAERSVYDALTAPSAEEQQQAFVDAVRGEVARRILFHASSATQINLAAAAAGGVLSDDQMGAYRAGLQWIAEVRGAGAQLAASGDPDFADDAKWPAIPENAAALAAQF